MIRATTTVLAALLLAGGSSATATANCQESRAVRAMPGMHRIDAPDVRMRHVEVTFVERLDGTRFYYELSNGAAWIADRPRACGWTYRKARCWEAAGRAGFDVTNPMTPIG